MAELLADVVVGIIQPWGEVDGVEVGLYHGDAVVVFAGGMALDGERGVAAYGQLEGVAEVAAHGVDVTVDEGDLCMAVGSHHVAEEIFVGMDAVAEDEDATGMADGLGGAVPGGDVAVGDDGLQLQWRYERGYGDGDALAFEAHLLWQPLTEEGYEVEGVDVVDVQVVLVLNIDIVGEVAVEVKGGGGCLCGKGGVVEGDHLHVIPSTKLVIYRWLAVLKHLLTMYEICPQCPGDIEIGLDLCLSAGEEAVEVLCHELLDVQKVLIDMAQDGIGGVVERGAEDIGDDGLEGVGVVEFGEVDDGVVGGFNAGDLTDESLCLFVDGCTVFHIGDFLEDADNEAAHLALIFIQMGIAVQFITDIAADGVALTVEVFGEAFDGIIYKLVETEGEALELLAEGFVDGLAFIGFEPGHYAGNEL